MTAKAGVILFSFHSTDENFQIITIPGIDIMERVFLIADAYDISGSDCIPGKQAPMGVIRKHHMILRVSAKFHHLDFHAAKIDAVAVF